MLYSNKFYFIRELQNQLQGVTQTQFETLRDFISNILIVSLCNLDHLTCKSTGLIKTENLKGVLSIVIGTEPLLYDLQCLQDIENHILVKIHFLAKLFLCSRCLIPSTTRLFEPG